MVIGIFIYLFQLFIIFHIEPHGEKEGLKTRYRKESRKESAGRCHRPNKESIDEQVTAKK